MWDAVQCMGGSVVVADLISNIDRRRAIYATAI